MGDVFRIGKRGRVTLDEARAVLPAVRRVTARAIQSVERIRMTTGQDPKSKALEALNAEIQDWADRVEQLGGEAKGLWRVDFDGGAGYYCWRWPETELSWFHGYDDGLAGRTRIQ